jgi:hypothetical protein
MTIDLTVWDRDAVAIQNDLPVSVVWKSQTYQAMRSERTKGRNIEFAGTEETLSVTILVIHSIWVNGIPKENDIVTLGSDKYRVIGTIDSPDNLSTQLQCEEADK